MINNYNCFFIFYIMYRFKKRKYFRKRKFNRRKRIYRKRARFASRKIKRVVKSMAEKKYYSYFSPGYLALG